MPEPTVLPPGLIPRFLSRAEAAAYVGVSTTTFDQEVSDGWWPCARRRGAKGTRLTWDRVLLDAAADRASGLQAHPRPGDAAAQDDTPAAAEAAALQGVMDAARRHRVKHRQPKAA